MSAVSGVRAVAAPGVSRSGRGIAKRDRVQAEPVEHEQNAPAETFNLESTLQLHPVAEAQPARPHDGEREMHEHEDTGEPHERSAHGLPPSALPALDQSEREQHERKHLRRDRECKEHVRRPLTPTQKRQHRDDRQERREEVVRVEEHGADK